MPKARIDGVTICYDTVGHSADPPLLLVHGYGAQLIQWPDEFCRALAGEGLFIIRYDNRDAGLSSKFDGRAPAFRTAPDGQIELAAAPPYSLRDMALDGLGLLTHLGYAAAHVAGASLGGGIVQRMAIDFPERVLTLTSIMSRPGPGAGAGTPEATSTLFAQTPHDRVAFIDHIARLGRVIGGAFYDEDEARRAAASRYDRCFYPEGLARQLAAYLWDGDRTEELMGVCCPTLVIHGGRDPLATLSGAEAIRDAVPGAELLVLPEMGHDLPRPLWPQIAAAISRHARGVGRARPGLRA